MEAPLRTTSQMSSRKLQALQFIKRYFVENGGSPSLNEIAARLDITKQWAHELVVQLAAAGLILHTPGKTRGIRLTQPMEELTLADALLVLRRYGLLVEGAPTTAAAPHLTPGELIGLPFLDHDPQADLGSGDDDCGAGRNGRS